MRNKRTGKLELHRETVRELTDAAMARVNGGRTAPVASVDICTYVSFNRCSDMPATDFSCVFTECFTGCNCPQTQWQCV